MKQVQRERPSDCNQVHARRSGKLADFAQWVRREIPFVSFFLSKYNLIFVVHFCHLFYYWLIFFSRCGQNSNALTAGWTKVSLNAVCRLNRCFGSNILWIIRMSWNSCYAQIAWLSTSFKMDAVRGVDTILETESQVQGERKGTMRCHVVAVTVIIIITMNIMTTIIILITSITMITTNNDQDKKYYSS